MSFIPRPSFKPVGQLPALPRLMTRPLAEPAAFRLRYFKQHSNPQNLRSGRKQFKFWSVAKRMDRLIEPTLKESLAGTGYKYETETVIRRRKKLAWNIARGKLPVKPGQGKSKKKDPKPKRVEKFTMRKKRHPKKTTRSAKAIANDPNPVYTD
eukprot:TRINITY_DN10831_c0_g1_i1.p1 TRINITY_DN10831_c0_g1~~TRINITY_DN10831_c0_g1_i1.p1  ORF type:complete len:169 (+),score=33.67 TRINITY_DN10831_c0_g1_i1:50-508(+)